MERIGKPGDIPPQIANAIAGTFWLLQVEAFREPEEKLLLAGEYEANLPEHRATLSQIISNGEQVVFSVQKLGMVSTPAGFDLEDLQSTLNSLNDALPRLGEWPINRVAQLTPTAWKTAQKS